MKDQAIYSSEHIQNLQFPDNVRTNASMYLGSTDADGRWLVVRELLDNGLDEFLAKRNDAVYLYEEQDDSYTVIDNGYGIPQGIKEYTIYLDGKAVKSSIPTMQAVFGQLNTSGKYRSEAYAVSVGCFVGETPVQLLDGRTLSFEELYKEFQQKQEPIPIMCWDIKHDKVAYSNISNVMLTKRTKYLVDVKLDSGEVIRCTPDHPFYIRTKDGIEEVYAQNLQPNTSLVSVHLKYSGSGDQKYYYSNALLRNNKDNGYYSLHRSIAAFYYGKKAIEGKDVHHKNRKPCDNRIENLQVVTKYEHADIHRQEKSELSKLLLSSKDIRQEKSKSMAASNKDAQLNKQRSIGNILNSAIRVLILANNVLTKETYTKHKLATGIAWENIEKYISYEDLTKQALEQKDALLERAKVSPASQRKLTKLLRDNQYQIAARTKASYKAAFRIWRKNIEKCLNAGYTLNGITPYVYIQCNSPKTPQKYNCYGTLRQHTTLKELISAYKENRDPRLFKDLSEEAKLIRLERASAKTMTDKLKHSIMHNFVLACRKLDNINKQDYDLTFEKTMFPGWERARAVLREVYGYETDEQMISFVKSYNTRVVSVKRVELDEEVPVYGMTVDTYHNYFIASCLVKNSHGCGSKGSNATSEFFHVKTCYQGKWYEIEFKQGHLTIPVRECEQPIYRGKPLQKGTMIHFKHDKEIFGTVGIDFKLAESWAEITSYLNPGFHVTLQDKHNHIKEYYSEQGPSEYVEKLIDQLKAQREELLFTFKNELCDIVIAFSNAENCNVRGYTNGLYNSDGGKHVDSVCQALFNVVKDFAKSKQTVQLQDFKEGLVGIINMHLHKAEFSSQDKLKLTDERAGDSLRQQIQLEAEKFFKKNKELALRLCEKSSKLSELRSQFKASKKMIAALNQAKKRGMPAKYSPFDSKTKVEDRELLIVEGLSAAGGLRQVRKPYQSLYPIKGKIKNLAKTTEQIGLESEEIINILSAIGYDPNKENPMANPTVGKIICLADADEDGPVSPKTRVLLCDGTIKTIKELADQWERDHQPIWVWSLDAQGKLHPAKAIEPRITCYKTKYARVYFDDGTRIACTLNHKFAINSVQSENLIIDEQTKIKYVAAKDLRAGDSIMSAYFKNAPLNGNKGSADYRYVYHDDYQRKYYPLHKLVAEDIYPEEYAIYTAKNKENKNSMAIHHKDHNRMNNSPENLEIITAYNHTKDHHSFNKSGYNGSALQKQKLKEYHASDKYRNEELPKLIQRTIEYNKSEKNRQSTAALNRRDDVKELQQLTRLSKKYLCIQEKYGQVTQMLWACTFAGAASTPSVIRKSDFTRIKQHLDTHKYIEPVAIKKVFSEDEVKDKFKFAIKRFILTCKSLYKENAKLTKELYNKFVEDEMIRKGSNRTGAIRWETAIGYLETFNHIDNENNIEQFIKEQCNNHRVVKVEIVELGEPKPFYCLTVPQYGNFLLADKNGNGICSSNCHINTLLLTLFFKICPQLFEKGMIYVADMYDYYAIYKDQVVIGNSAQEVQEKLHKIGAPVYIASNHVKGWGELDYAVMKVLAVDKETRKLIRIKPITDHDRTAFVRIMNDDVEYRRKMLGLADNV